MANAAVPARNVAERAGGHEEDTTSATEVKGEGHALSEAEAECADAIGVLAPRLRDGHDFQQVAIRVLEVEAPPASTAVDLAVGVVEWSAAVGQSPGLHPAEDGLELRLADMEGIVMALACPRVEPRSTPGFWGIGEVQGEDG